MRNQGLFPMQGVPDRFPTGHLDQKSLQMRMGNREGGWGVTEVIGVTGCCDGEVGFCFVFPFVLKIFALETCKWN